MNHIVILKATNHVNNGVDLTDVGQELVPKAFSLAGSFHQAGDIHKFHPCGDGFGAFAQIRELLQPRIRN